MVPIWITVLLYRWYEDDDETGGAEHNLDHKENAQNSKPLLHCCQNCDFTAF
jgi:hypothetical protein